MNSMAAHENAIQQFEHEHERRRERERLESLEQQMRDRKVMEAQMEADRGASVLTQAFAQIPMAARQRYPGLCVELGTVQLPVLKQTNDFGTQMLQAFGGDMGDMIAEMQSGDKIRQNLAMMQVRS